MIITVYEKMDGKSRYTALLRRKRNVFMKRIIPFILAAAVVCGAFVSCGGSKKKAGTPTSEAVTAESEVQDKHAGVDIDFEDTKAAESGDAYLAIVNSDWKVQYWGDAEDVLAYNAGVTHINGNGDYTVSVTADTKGFRYDTTGNAEGENVPSGLAFMSVMINDGETLYPNAVITVNSIKVDGKEIAMTSKPYTSSDDGKETRANLYNEWVSKPSEDARSTQGALYNGGEPADFCGDYSATVVNAEDFASWSNVEVNFTVSGI